MKAARFEYRRPSDLAEAVALLAGADGVAKVIAGGQSLGPMLNLRLVQPDLLVDVSRLPETTGIREERDVVAIGACVTHAALEDGLAAGPAGAFLAKVAANIAYRAVRNRGTIGGSLAHADPAADWVTALTALGATVALVGPGGTRSLVVENFISGAFETALAPDEVLRDVRVPLPSPKARWGYWKFCRKAGEFPQAIGAVLVDPDRLGLRAVIGATNGRPIVLGDQVDEAAAGRALDAAGYRDDPYGRRLHLVALKRALERARA